MRRKKYTFACQSCAHTFIQITLINYVKKWDISGARGRWRERGTVYLFSYHFCLEAPYARKEQLLKEIFCLCKQRRLAFSLLFWEAEGAMLKHRPISRSTHFFLLWGKGRNTFLFLVRSGGQTGCGARYPFANADKNIWYLHEKWMKFQISVEVLSNHGSL